MLSFKKLTLADAETVRPFFRFETDRICDNTVGGTLMWRDFFQTEFAIHDDTLVLKVTYFGGVSAFTVPTGKDPFGCLALIDEYCVSAGLSAPTFCACTREDLAILSGRYSVHLVTDRKWSDYLYSADDLKNMTGHKYNGQRNHMNYFRRTYPDFLFLPLEGEVLSGAAAFFAEYGKTHVKDAPMFEEERRKVFEILENFGTYGLSGGALIAEGRIVSFAIGEVIGDTLFVHVEKADPEVRGAYQMTVSEFTKAYAADGVLYINREEDDGDEGLRISKLSYHPIRLIDKYMATVTGYTGATAAELSQ